MPSPNWKPRSLTEDEAPTWVGLQLTGKGSIKPGDANPPILVGFAVDGPVILLEQPPRCRMPSRTSSRPISVHGAPSHDVSRLLARWRDGDEAALQELVPIVHEELRRLARRQMAGERPGHTLQPTALVNEAYLRLVNLKQMQWQNRAHFFGICARLMRRVLTDFARSGRYLKRGGGSIHVALDEALAISPMPGADLVALDDALNALAAIDPRKSRVVELRFFGGLSTGETAEVLKVSPETVRRDWRLARMWLLREISGEKDNER